MPGAVERMVVQATANDQKVIAAKAKRMDLGVSALMRRGAFACEPNAAEAASGALADVAKASANRAGQAIDDALGFIDASHLRIAALERKAANAVISAKRSAS